MCDYTMCPHSHHPWGISFVIRFQLWSLFMQLVGHYVAIKWPLLYYLLPIIMQQLCHYMVTHMLIIITYICVITRSQYWHYFITRWPWRCHYLAIHKVLLIHYPYKMWIFTPQIGSQCYITWTILKIFILEVHHGIQAYTPIKNLSYMSKCEIDTSWFFCG
jgi:hypothetical protein